MRVPQVVYQGLTVAMLLLLIVILGGQLLGQPTFIFVETDSMEPTLAPGDGYVAIPETVAGEIKEGDVILFEADEVGGGGLTTHRVEAVTGEGIITKGDNNPFTDQDGGEPLVSRGQVRSVAWQPGGDLVVLPRLGLVVTTVSGLLQAGLGPLAGALGIENPDTQALGLFVVLAGLVLLVVSVFTEGEVVRDRIRKRKDLLENVFVVIAVLSLLMLIPLNISMLLPSGIYSIEIVSTEDPSGEPGLIQAGTSEPIRYVLKNSGYLPIVVFLEPASDGVEPPGTYLQVSPRDTVEADVIVHAPEETGPHLRMVHEYRYLMVLPPSVLTSLHRIHPFAAVGAINLVMAGFITILTIATVGTERDRSRVRDRDVSTLDRLLR